MKINTKTSKRDVSYPFDWIMPGERRYDSSGENIVKGRFTTPILAFWRRYILRKPPLFWMYKK